ncbi:MAG TPA: hypothetical protein VN515_05920 [Terriglobales bacterium]|nr:hypothetical protein [Terriglobales bacterium]
MLNIGTPANLNDVPWLALVKEQLGLKPVSVPGHVSRFVIDNIEHLDTQWTLP